VFVSVLTPGRQSIEAYFFAFGGYHRKLNIHWKLLSFAANFEHLMRVCGKNLRFHITSSCFYRKIVDGSGIPRFDKCLEHFFSLCDQLEVQLVRWPKFLLMRCRMTSAFFTRFFVDFLKKIIKIV